MKKNFFLLLLFIGSLSARSQDSFPFKIAVEPLFIEGFNGLQSYAWAKNGNQVLLVGGRKDGLHRRQPFASFSKKENNTEIIVIDLEKNRSWKKSVLSLPASLAEQLQSSNMQFYQHRNELILTGGYGYSETRKDHITHPSLVIIKVKELIQAVINDQDISGLFQQIVHEKMAVTGGRLHQLGDTYYLVGGQKFDGRYNPHGPDHGPGFSQQYSNQVRTFKLTAKEDQPLITDYKAITDTALFHRRDYNLLPQYDLNGNEMLTIYSGVFRPDKDLPYTTLVDITADQHRELTGFNQQFSHYHTAFLPVYDQAKKTQYAIFFGGIALQYRSDSGLLKTDDQVPFVKHFSVVERSPAGTTEYLLPEGFSGYFGAAAEFIPADPKLFTSNGMLIAAKAGKKSVTVGYIFGGIDSRAENVFWSNDPAASRASPVIWKINIAGK